MSAFVHLSSHSEATEATEAERLGAEIAEPCGYIAVATSHLLELIREFDANRYWALLASTCGSRKHWKTCRRSARPSPRAS